MPAVIGERAIQMGRSMVGDVAGITDGPNGELVYLLAGKQLGEATGYPSFELARDAAKVMSAGGEKPAINIRQPNEWIRELADPQGNQPHFLYEVERQVGKSESTGVAHMEAGTLHNTDAGEVELHTVQSGLLGEMFFHGPNVVESRAVVDGAEMVKNRKGNGQPLGDRALEGVAKLIGRD